MGTRGKHWQRRGIKWTLEIQEWLKARCPAREHGYTCRAEILSELNKKFGTNFSMPAFVTHCNESGIQLGFAVSNGTIPRGEKHWRHRPVGSLQTKKGYVRIKVAEPNVWMQYQRYIWEQHHPGESAEGCTVIFMDGDNRNFDPDNLERVTRGELSVMNELGHTASMTRTEREIILLRARIALAKSKLVGREEANRIHRAAWYERMKDVTGFKEARSAYAKRRREDLKATPEGREKLRQKAQKSNAKRRKKK